MMMMKTFEGSPMPNQRMEMEIHAMGGMGFIRSKMGLTMAFTCLFRAIMSPRGTAIRDAMEKPIRIRRVDAQMCPHKELPARRWVIM